MDNSVIFKGTKNGLKMILNDEVSFDELLQMISARIEQAGKFFQGASIHVYYTGRILSDEEAAAIVDLMGRTSGAKITGIEEQKEETAPANEFPSTRETETPVSMAFNGIHEGYTKFYRGTLRSGALLNYRGNIVVIGDVNPGAHVEAGGNVVVLGALRGTVHAGCTGNKEAVIVAFNLQPTQLRIADIITRPPDEKGNRVVVPELAYIKDDRVYIENYLPTKG